MQSSRQQLVTALAAVFYGVVFALGQALHGLPGLAHSDQPSGADCCCCIHLCQETAPQEDGPTSDGPTSDGHGASDDSSCPLCDLLALAQDRPPVADEPLIWAVCGVAPPAQPLQLTSPPFDLYAARGPPAGHLVCA